MLLLNLLLLKLVLLYQIIVNVHEGIAATLARSMMIQNNNGLLLLLLVLL